jgi:RNA polymerase-binding transcription factor DksA
MPSETPTDAPATDYRSLLLIEQANLEAELSELGFDHGKTGLDYDANFADTSQVTAERGEAEALAGKLKDTLEEVHAAIRRLDDGTYGRCEVDGEAISPARLEAMPATRFCIDHANRS